MSFFSGSLIPDKFNETIIRGGTFIQTNQWTDGIGQPFNFTPWTVDAQIRASYTASAPVVANFGIVFVGPKSSGSYQMVLSSVSSSLLTGSAYYYDVRITAGSEIYYLANGKLTVSPAITRG